MSFSIKLAVQAGDQKGKEYSYNQYEKLVIGRNKDCAIVLSDSTISRYHCLIEIAPPMVAISDFGSMNATYINDVIIGQRPKDMTVYEAYKLPKEMHPIQDGDVIGLGSNCKLRVSISKSVPQNKKHTAVCNICANELSVNEQKRNETICTTCRKNPEHALDGMLKRASSGEPGFKSFRGYSKGRCLGRGGMGVVWEVVDPRGKKQALKIMLPENMGSEYSELSFLREGSLMQQLKHKNIADMYNFGRVSDLYFMLMELYEMGSLRGYMQKTKRLFDVKTATPIILQVLSALEYAHKTPIKASLPDGSTVSVNGIVHRDIKPDNILLTKSMEAKLADFGLAKSFQVAGLSGMTGSGVMGLGTLPFMPRQQILDPRYAQPFVDLWAVMATFYFLLTGEYPKELGTDPDKIAFQAIASSAVPIRKRNSSLPTKLSRVIDDALLEDSIEQLTASDLIKQVQIAI